jgi:TldD protein
MKRYTDTALDVIKSKGATYGDIRIIETKGEGLIHKDGKLGGVSNENTLGYGIRVIKNGAWGFASSDKMGIEDIKKCASFAVSVAEASSLTRSKKVELAPKDIVNDIWISDYQTDPFKVSLEDKLKVMEDVYKVASKKKEIKEVKVFMNFLHEHKYFASTEGDFIEQVLLMSGGGFNLKASDGDDIQTRSYPFSFEGMHKLCGYEIITALDMAGNAERVRDEAIALLKAKECPSGEGRDIILMPSQLVLQIHESVGHANELDRILGYEADFAGTSFVKPSDKDNLSYASGIVNLVADATLPGGLATCGYDDDGVRSTRWHIVKNGLHKGFMVNRETAFETGLLASTSCNRAESFSDIPITRISNLSLMPAAGSLDDLIADTKNGILMDTNKSWSIDQRRQNFQFGCEAGWEIKNGKIKKMVKNPYYKGMSTDFWNSCDFICGPEEWELHGVLNCGKGQPMQVSRMSHGSSPARFKDIMLGS